jgi:hypothetical protein
MNSPVPYLDTWMVFMECGQEGEYSPSEASLYYLCPSPFFRDFATPSSRKFQNTWIGLQLYSFFNLGTKWGWWSTQRPGRFIPKNDPVSIVEGLEGPQSRPRQLRKSISPTGIRSPDSAARSESLYWLSYTDSPSVMSLLVIWYPGLHVEKKSTAPFYTL